MGQKATKYAVNGAIIVGLGNGLINALKQAEEMSENPEKEFDWGSLLKAIGKGALIGGAGGLTVGGIIDYQNSKETPLNTNEILSAVVAGATLNKNNPIYRKLSGKANIIIKMIESHYLGLIEGSIQHVGSTEDGTALSEDFDIDISIPFSRNSFRSTAEMMDDLYDFIGDTYEDYDLVKIRQQTKSIGLIFEIDGKRVSIDLVPYKLSNNHGTSGYLFVKSNSIFQKDGYTKTDICALQNIKLTEVQQKLLIGFKAWKKNYSIPISSHLLRLIIIDAYDSNKGIIPYGLTQKILMVVRHLEQSIMYKRIVSVENTNNVLTEMSNADKRTIQQACLKILNDYEYQPNSILKYFE